MTHAQAARLSYHDALCQASVVRECLWDIGLTRQDTADYTPIA